MRFPFLFLSASFRGSLEPGSSLERNARSASLPTPLLLFLFVKNISPILFTRHLGKIVLISLFQRGEKHQCLDRKTDRFKHD